MTIPSIFLRSQVTPFVVLFVERSGSSALRSLMDSHPDIATQGEVFAILRHGGKGPADQLNWAKQFLTPPLIGRYKAVGFKTKVIDVLDRAGLATLLRQRGCRIIQLQRHNAVKGVISTINARKQWEKSGAWNLLDESNRLPSFSLDLDEFDRLLREREKLDEELEAYAEQLDLPTLRLCYEDLLQDEKAFIGRVFDFLEVKTKPVKLSILKNTQDDLRKVINNFDELRERYSGSRYATMIEEVLADS